jgi:hypothetical protein
MRIWIVPLSAALAFSMAHADGGGPGDRAGGKQAGKRAGPQPRANPAPKGVAAPSAVRTRRRSEIEFGAPIKFHNISIVPVTTKKIGDFQSYTLLEQGIAKKTLRVRELAGNNTEAQVEHVEVLNRGEDPVYLLGGEMILGGKQDRIIGADTVIPATGKWVKVGVFCVEQGRWRGQNMKFEGGGAMADVSIRRAAMQGSQSEVWNEVAKKNVLHGTQSSTQTYRRTIQNAKVRKKIKPYIRQLRAQLPRDERLAGLVFGINGTIHVADIFGNPVLFADLSDKLLSAYVLEALGHQVDEKAAPVSSDAAKTFIGKARRTKTKGVKKSGRARNMSKENPEFIGNETVDAESDSTVRESYIKKK